MDKQEYLEIVGDIRHAYDRKEYDKVVMYADELEMRKVTDGRVLEMIADAYDAEGDAERARELLEKAYEKTPMGRKLAYKLSEMAIRENDLDAAVTYYEDFRKMAPHDNDRILLKYKIGKAAGVAEKDLAKVLAAYCSREIDEQWMAELAGLYQDLGEKEKCNEVCDNIILWFADGIYVQRALELKQSNGGLTEAQQEKLEQLKAAAAAPMQPAYDDARDERELRPGSMEPETITDDDLDSILEEYITIEDATAPPPRMATEDLSDVMNDTESKKEPEKEPENFVEPETEVIPVEEIRKADLSRPAARTEILQAKEAAKKAAEEESIKIKEDQTAKEIENEIVLEEMELKTLPVHEEVQEAIAENIGQPEPEEVPDILAAVEEKPAVREEPEEMPAEPAGEASAETPEEEPKEPLFTAAEAAGKPFSNIEALQIARTAPPKDEASFWKMPEELSVGEEPKVEEFEEPVYGSHRWFEQPQNQEPEFEEPVFGSHRYVPEPEEDPYTEDVEIEQVEPEPIVIEQAEDEEFYQPRVSTIRTTSSGAELAGLYASAKYAEQDAQLSEQAAFVRKPSLGIKKVLSPEMFADPIAEPEYYEGPAYETEPAAEAGTEAETVPEPQPYTEFEVFEAEEKKPEGPSLFPGFGEERKVTPEPAPEAAEEPLPEAEPAVEEPETEESLPEAEPETESEEFGEVVQELEVSRDATGNTAFIRAVNAFDLEQSPEDASALETEFIPATEVAELIKTEKSQEEEVNAAGMALVDALFAEEEEENLADLFPEDFEEKLLEFDRSQQKEAEEQSELVKTIQDLKQRIADLEQAQSKAETAAPAEETVTEETPAEEILTEEPAEEAAEEPLTEEEPAEEAAEEAEFMLDGSLIDAIIEEDEQPAEEEEEVPAEEAVTEEPTEEAEEEEAEEPAEDRPSPFLFSVMPHETIEEDVPEPAAFDKNIPTPAEEPLSEPESTPSVFIPSLNPRTEMPEAGKGVIPVPESSITEAEEEELKNLMADEAFEKELLGFDEEQKEDQPSEFGEVVQELELSNRAEELWEEAEPEEPRTDEAPVVEITASIPSVEEEAVLPVSEEPEAIEVPAPVVPDDLGIPVLETPEEIAVPAPEAEIPEEKTGSDRGPELVGFFTTKMKERERAALREAAEAQERKEPELSDFEKAMLAFEESNPEVPEEEFTPDELKEAMDEFLDESVEPWEEPEFGMPDFTESEFEQPEFLGADFDEPEIEEPEAEEPEIEEPETEEPEISAPEEAPADISEEELEAELSDFEKALLAFDNSEAAKKEAAAAEPVFPVETPEEVTEEVPEEEPEEAPVPETKAKETAYQIPDDMREELSEFLLIDGMEERICKAIDSIITNKRNGDPTGGHLIITGDAKSGKTYLTISLIKAVGKEIGSSTGRVAKVQAEALNGKDMNKVFTKIKGSDLIIENAGYLDDETAENMIATMKTVSTSSMVILEGNELGVENILTKHPQLEEIFRTRLDLAELSLSQWADLACAYAEEKGYTIDDMALLALHAKIDEMNLPTTRLVVEDVQGIIDRAIEKAGRRSIGRRAKKKGRDGAMELNETDFM